MICYGGVGYVYVGHVCRPRCQDLDLDCEEDSVTLPCNPKRRAARVAADNGAGETSSPLPRGPRTYEEICCWARDSAQRILDKVPGSRDVAAANVRAGVWLTTDYSGIGTPEISMSLIMEPRPAQAIARRLLCAWRLRAARLARNLGTTLASVSAQGMLGAGH